MESNGKRESGTHVAVSGKQRPDILKSGTASIPHGAEGVGIAAEDTRPDKRGNCSGIWNGIFHSDG